MAMTSMSRRSTAGTTLAALLTLMLAACSGSNSARESTPPATSSATTAQAAPTPDRRRIDLPVKPGHTVEGLLDVHGHDIYARCAGHGSPTVVYFTGWADDASKQAVSIATGIEESLGRKIRLCSYERRNTGRSEKVKGTQSPVDVIADVDGFLSAVGEKGPFVLLGASFGGLVSSAYAVAHPERVAGVVLLDASTAVDYKIEAMGGFHGACLKANRRLDAFHSVEKVDNCRLTKWIYSRLNREPDVPLLYLAAASSPERTEQANQVVKAWVKTWSPGTWRVVTSPHYMDEADTDLVAEAVRKVINLTRR